MTKITLDAPSFEQLRKILKNYSIEKTIYTFTAETEIDSALFRLQLRLKKPNECCILQAAEYIMSDGQKLRFTVKEKAFLFSLLSVYVFKNIYGY